jgi:hypothetical protein
MEKYILGSSLEAKREKKKKKKKKKRNYSGLYKFPAQPLLILFLRKEYRFVRELHCLCSV